MNEDLKALSDTVSAIQAAAAEVDALVETAKAEGAQVTNLATSPNRTVMIWPNGYEVAVTIALPEAKLLFTGAIFPHGRPPFQCGQPIG